MESDRGSLTGGYLPNAHMCAGVSANRLTVDKMVAGSKAFGAPCATSKTIWAERSQCSGWRFFSQHRGYPNTGSGRATKADVTVAEGKDHVRRAVRGANAR